MNTRDLRQRVRLRTRLRAWQQARQAAQSRLGRRYRERTAPFRPKRYRTADLDSANLGILSTDPPIFYVKHWMDEELRFVNSLQTLFDYLREGTAYFLYSWMWHIDEPRRVEIVRAFENQHRRKYHKHHFVHLSNSLEQYEAFRAQKLDAVFCSSNCVLDENIFRPLPDRRPIYDAVYDARLKQYKRHFLARQVENLALIYDLDPVVDDLKQVDILRQQFADAHFFNHEPSGAYRRLTPEEVNECLNQCGVGLCLSQVEGAMYASTQYLLAGLPVVSTRSKGGREVFFDPAFALIVPDHPEAVREGVQEMRHRQISAETIRARTLGTVRQHRATLIALIQSIYDREGIRRNFASEWDGVFFNGMTRYQKHSDTIAALESGVRSGKL